MPIKINNDLPAKKILQSENIFVMDEDRASHQDIRPLQIAILNLMPLKQKTEEQLLRMLSNSPLQVEITLISPESYRAKNTSSEHLSSFYKSFEMIKSNKFDGFIITGAPVEQMAFEDVAYWKELEEILEWTKTNVTSTFHICWGAQAGLYFHYGIDKRPLPSKAFGVFKHELLDALNPLVRGFDDVFFVPHSRHTTISREDILKHPELVLVSESSEAGVYLVMSKDGKQIFVTGHSEYDADTLKNEYVRDQQKGLSIELPKDYFPGDDENKMPPAKWRSHAHLLYSNWLNYYVYQMTPYLIENIE